MKKRIYLHIGLHKTGSTTIQIALHRQLALLRAQSFDLPSVQDGYPYHHTLVEDWVRLTKRFRTGLDADTSWNQMLASFERTNCQAGIISSEELSNVAIGDEQVAQFAERLADYEVFVILYLRRQDSFLESAYKEVKKHSHWESFDQYWKHAVEGTLQLDFVALATLWQRHFGSESLRLFDYHRIAAEGKDLVASFLELCDLPPKTLKLTGGENANVSDSNLSIALKDYFELNALQDADERIAPMIPVIEQHLRTHSMTVSFIPGALHREITDRYIAHNASLEMVMTDHLRGKNTGHPVSIEELLAVPALRKHSIKQLLLDRTPGSRQPI